MLGAEDEVVDGVPVGARLGPAEGCVLGTLEGLPISPGRAAPDADGKTEGARDLEDGTTEGSVEGRGVGKVDGTAEGIDEVEHLGDEGFDDGELKVTGARWTAGGDVGVWPGLEQSGGCLGTQVGKEELPLWMHTAPGSQQSEAALHFE